MSLIRLLTVSPAFTPGPQETGRYRLSGRRSLPDFGLQGQTTPFAPKTTASVEGRTVKVQAPPRDQGAKSLFAAPSNAPADELSFSQINACHRHPEDAPTRSASAVALEKPPGFWRRLRDWWGRNPERPAARTRERLPAEQRFVQTTFQIEKVKVMRNDLSEGDFEVVMKRPVADKSETSSAAGVTGSARAGGGLFRPAMRWWR